MAAINAQMTIEFKIFNKFSREEFSRTPYKARLCISERRRRLGNRGSCLLCPRGSGAPADRLKIINVTSLKKALLNELEISC